MSAVKLPLLNMLFLIEADSSFLLFYLFRNHLYQHRWNYSELAGNSNILIKIENSYYRFSNKCI